MIEMHNVWKSVARASSRNQWTLEDVTVSFPAGLRIALMGADQAANSLALRILAGLEMPDRGAIRRTGSVCWPFDYVGFVDTRGTFSQNVNFLAQVYGVNSGDMLSIATQLTDVSIVRGKPLYQYMAHDRKAFALALTLSLQFDWYFVDEKLPRARDSVAAQVEAVIADRLSHGSVIWATTKPQLLEGYCNAALILDQGALTFYDDFSEALDAFTRANQTKIVDEAKSRKTGRRGRAARRQSEVDSENAG